jgi:hypothetical protein
MDFKRNISKEISKNKGKRQEKKEEDMEEGKSSYIWFRPTNTREAVDTLNQVMYVIAFLSESLDPVEAGEHLELSDEASSGLCFVLDFIEETMRDSLELIDIKEIKEA